jgi:hypothetical protein
MKRDLDGITLWVGIAIGTLILLYSYAVSAGGLMGLGEEFGFAEWQRPGIVLIADGVATYGLLRVVTRSKYGDQRFAMFYGWFLVLLGSTFSVVGNIMHAQERFWAQVIAAAFPIVVMLMIEAIRGDFAFIMLRLRRVETPQGAMAHAHITRTQMDVEIPVPNQSRVIDHKASRELVSTKARIDARIKAMEATRMQGKQLVG